MEMNRLYDKKFLGLDNLVWLVIICLVALSVFFLTYKLLNQVECKPFTFTFTSISVHSDQTFNAGEAISFRTSVDDDNMTWNYGDNSAKEQGPITIHRFINSGDFYVTAKTNSICAVTKKITIVDIAQPVSVQILGASFVTTDSENVFRCSTIANSYDWVIVGHPEIKNTGTDSIAKFVFNFPGSFEIQLTLNNDITKRAFAFENVSLAASVDTAKKKKQKSTVGTGINTGPTCSQFISPQNFQAMLVQVINNSMDASSFSQYVCNENSIMVLVNGKQKFSFTELCKRLGNISTKNKPKIVIGLLQLNRANNDLHKPIESMSLGLKIKGKIGPLNTTNNYNL